MKKEISFKEIIYADKFLLLILGVFSFLIFFTKTSGLELPNYDDCYYAQKAKELLEARQLWSVTFNEVPSFDNPPFYFWLVALSFKVFGVTDFAARLPSQLMGVLAVTATFSLAKYIYNCKWVAFLSGVVLSTSYMFIRYTRHSMVDSTLVAFTVLAILFLLLAVNENKKYFWLWGLSISVCILTKSVLGVFPVLVSGFYLFSCFIVSQFGLSASQPNKSANSNTLSVINAENASFVSQIWNKHFISSCFLLIGFGGFWYLHEYLVFGDAFINKHFGWLIFQRGFDGLSVNRKANYLFYIKDVFIFYWPWLPFFFIGLFSVVKDVFKALQPKQIKQKHLQVLTIIIWFVTVFIVMSIMKTQSKWYVLSTYPAMAIISAVALNKVFSLKLKKVLVQSSFIFIPLLLFVNFYPVSVHGKPKTQELKAIRQIYQDIKNNNPEVPIYSLNIPFHDVNNYFLYYGNFTTKSVEKLSDLNKRESLKDKSYLLLILNSSFEKIEKSFPEGLVKVHYRGKQYSLIGIDT